MRTTKSSNTATATSTTSTADEAGTKSLKVSGNIVTASLVVRRNKDAAPVELTAELDFTGISSDQILVWAARTKIIDLQRALRLCDEAFLRKLAANGPIHRKASIAGTGFVDPAKAMQSLADRISAMSDDERAALMALLKNNI